MSRAGSIKKDTKAGTWYFVIDLAPPGATDRQQIKRRGFPTKVAAREAMDKLKESVRRGEYVEPSRLTFGGYLREWIDGRVTAGLRDTTAGSYREKLESYVLSRPIADIRLQALTALDLDRPYTNCSSPGAAPASRPVAP
jgi:hypothetical protein